MKLRSALLLACLIVVPLLAMVSHKIPAATRAAVRETLWSPFVGVAAPSMASAGPPATVVPPAGEPASIGVSADPTAVDAVPDPLRQVRSAGTAPAPPDAVRPLMATPAIDPSALPWEPTVPSPSTPPPPPAILVGAESSLPIGAVGGRESLEARLRALGATRIDWTPAQGGDGLHRCSCRIPAEPTGQLHRVFQAAAADPLAALDNLVGQVTAWSMRTGGAAEGGMAAGSSLPRR